MSVPFNLNAATVRWNDGWFQCIVLYYSMQKFDGSIYDMGVDGFRPIRIPACREGCKTSESLLSFLQPFRRIVMVSEICRGVRHVGRSSLYRVEGKSAMQLPPVLKCPMTFLFLVNPSSNMPSYHNHLDRAGLAGGDSWTAKARADASRLYAPQPICRVEACLMHL